MIIDNEYNQCTRKYRFLRRLDATRAARESRSTRLEAYCCPWCHGWHIGHHGVEPEPRDPLRKHRLTVVRALLLMDRLAG